MKLTSVALVCLLLAAMCLQALDGKSMHVSSSNCCYTSTTRRIHEKFIKCYKNTSSSCSYKDQVIFKLKRGKESCASKTEPWVRDYLNKTDPCT
ncbi:C-C motif chemokine 1 [Talpa occidentalis]|uniref:C-C motif chemokine 1 n=1 Tax=Talpa occidentalis TaxID=50954 RepID=UPI00188EEA9B|nr:C-C motif chemokine 1 [Talpa occidentalis]